MLTCKFYALAAASLLFTPAICSRAQAPAAPPPAAPSTQPASVTAEQVQQLQKTADNLNKAADDAADSATKLSTVLNTAVGPAASAAKDANDAADKANQASQDLDARIKELHKAPSKASVQPAHPAKRPIGDYVPCLFDDGQNNDLRALAYRDKNTVLTSDQIDHMIQDIPVILNPPALASKASKAETDARNATLQSIDTLKTDLQNIESILPNLQPEQVSSLVQQLGTGNGLNADQLKQLKAYFQVLNPDPTYDRPNDVSCSFSVLQWKETKDVFGRRVANDYVALEVNLRNLNTQNEFLVHDIQIAVDTGLTPWEFGRFEASRDKQLVRGVVQRGQSEDRRNLIINSLTAAGAILSPVSAAVADAGGGFGVGVSIFQGPFLVGANSIFPDHTIEYLNNLNDLGFSPSSTNKTVVPVQGSVPLVTFLAEKPLEQLPFVRCGQNHMTHSDITAVPTTVIPSSLANLNCQLHPDNWSHDDNTFDNTLTGEFQKPLRFKDWDGAAQNIFGHRVFVVIGGVHIQQVASGPAITSLTCPLKSDQKSVDTSKDPVTCTLSGSNLDQVASIKLEQGSLTPIAGTLTAYASGNTATISFKASDVATAKANGSYELFLTPTGGGKDIDSKQAVSFTTCTAAPSAPAAPVPVASSSTAINLNWTAVTPPANCTISSYKVYGSSTKDFAPSASNLITCPAGLTCAETGLDAATQYYYIVEAVDEVGASPPSSQGTAKTAPKPAAATPKAKTVVTPKAPATTKPAAAPKPATAPTK